MFAGGDAVYVGNAWSEVLNLAQSPDYWTVDLRVGVQSQRWRLEAFVKNAFDEYYYSSIARSADFTKGTFDISDFVVNATPGNPRQFGIRATWKH
jgi:outer membrane receptor protein involved in Fe transport